MISRRLFLFAIVLLITGAGSQTHAEEATAKKAKTVRLLNVGNSFSGNATQYLGSLAKASGHVLIHRQANIGGATMAQHWEKVEQHEQEPQDPRGLYANKRSLGEELRAEPWDVVTIQQASIRSHDVTTYRPYAEKLRDFIKRHAPTAEIMLHETWAYRRDDPRFAKPSGKPGEPTTQQAMYEGLASAYGTLAKELGVRIIPVGDAFHAADNDPQWGYRTDAKFDLQTAISPTLPDQTHSLHVGWRWMTTNGKTNLAMDGHHANTAGCYLGSCVFYESLYRESVVENSFVPRELDADYARFLRQTAHAAVEKAAAAKR
jgi:hypothetical protein